MNPHIRHLMFLMLLGNSYGAVQAQKLELDKSEYEMATGQQCSFAVHLREAAHEYNALTFSMLMPEGINLVRSPQITDQLKNPFCVTQEMPTLPTQQQQDTFESMMFWAQGDMSTDKSIKIAIASSAPLQGTETNNLLTIDINADTKLQPAMQVIKLQNILFEYAPKGKDNVNDLSVRVRVYPLGDNNRDDHVDVADATNMIANILSNSSTVDYNVMLSDMNNDGIIDIYDVMKLVNVILTGKLPVVSAPSMLRAANGFYEDMTLSFSQNGVTMGIPNAQRFTSFQFELKVPDGAKLSEAKLIGMTTNHMVQFAKIDDNNYRVIGLSLNNSLLEGNNGSNLIGLEIPNCDKLSIHNAMFVSPQGEITYFNDNEIESGITGIRPVIASDSESAYDLLGRKVQTKDGRLPKGIYIINNKRVVIK